MTDTNDAYIDREEIVHRCAKIVRLLGPSGSPGATASAMDRNATIIARQLKSSDLFELYFLGL
jgi:hypothetical protein